MSQFIDVVLSAEQLEGTSAKLSQWLFVKGDIVQKGQPLAEIETDKVVMEISAPCDGTLQSLYVDIGDTIETDVAIAQIDPQSNQQTVVANTSSEIKTAVNAKSNTATISTNSELALETQSKDASLLISPAVRRLLSQHQLNMKQITGSGRNGRVTRDDVQRYLKNPIQTATSSSTLESTMIPHSNMRRSIAKHMVESLLHTSPHVTSVFQMNLSHIIEHRKWHKKEFAEKGVKLTFTAYFLAAIVKAVEAVPQVNARFHQDALEIFKQINIGVGTALGDSGLIVPVIQQVQNMNLFQIAKALSVQTEKARTSKLTPADLKNGTFTISNHGVSGSLFATPIIINQPEVAILGIGKMEKRVVVETINQQDSMVIKPMCYVSLTIDHRALDAHQTNLFLSHFVETIEQWG